MEQRYDVVDEVLPEFGEIEGQTIRLAGLDYALLTQEKQKDKKGMLEQIKMRIEDYSSRIKDHK